MKKSLIKTINLYSIIILIIIPISTIGCDLINNENNNATKPCHTLDPFTYESGIATQINNSTDYDLSQCKEYININVSGYASYHQEALRITGMGLKEAFKRVQPGIIENEFKITLDQVFSNEGGGNLAFDHIIASGPNSLILHYSGSNRVLQNGDLLLMDVGSTYNEYCADISRTVPVNDTFTDRQKEVYELVLEVQAKAAQTMKPGIQFLYKMTKFAQDEFRKSPLRAKDSNGVERTMDYFFKHSLSHYIGKYVHGGDTGWSMFQPIKEGQIFTIEPGLYLKSEGFGIRIEDVYIVTSNGVVNLFKNIPKTVEDIENVLSQSKKKYIMDRTEMIKHVNDLQEPNRHMDF